MDVETEPPASGGKALAVELAAPGASLTVDASGTFADVCLSGSLQFEFTVNGVVEQPWSSSPMFTTALEASVNVIVVVARCSTDPDCTGTETINVTVLCPNTLTPGGVFPTIFGQADEQTYSWTGVLPYDVYKGDVLLVSSYDGSIVIQDVGTSFVDAAVPAAPVPPATSTGFYYVLRATGAFCNNQTGWTSGGDGECIGVPQPCTNPSDREGDLP
jgi:hypothetical protein